MISQQIDGHLDTLVTTETIHCQGPGRRSGLCHWAAAGARHLWIVLCVAFAWLSEVTVLNRKQYIYNIIYIIYIYIYIYYIYIYCRCFHLKFSTGSGSKMLQGHCPLLPDEPLRRLVFGGVADHRVVPWCTSSHFKARPRGLCSKNSLKKSQDTPKPKILQQVFGDVWFLLLGPLKPLALWCSRHLAHPTAPSVQLKSLSSIKTFSYWTDETDSFSKIIIKHILL